MLRRYALGDLREGISFERVADGGDDEGLACVCVESNAEWTSYEVGLPTGWRVKPSDLRRFAYDHEKVTQLLVACAQDNMRTFVFEPLSSEVMDRMVGVVETAVHDLSSVFDLRAVTCERDQDGLLIHLEGDFKNGERQQITISGALGTGA